MATRLPGPHGFTVLLFPSRELSDHSFSHVSVLKVLTCSEAQSARALAPSLFGEEGTRSLTMECVAEAPVDVFAALFAVVASLSRRINYRAEESG